MKISPGFLDELYQQDIRLWVEEGQLQCDGPAEKVTPALIRQLQEHKADLLALLQQVQSHQCVPTIQPVPRTGPLPLSFAQQRLWFLAELGSGAAYNIPLALEITGKLAITALQQTLQAVVQRHESLRTTIALHEGTPYQVIQPAPLFALPVIDLRGSAGEAQTNEIKRLGAAEALRPFDLAQDLLLRGQVLQVADERFILLLTMHHIASDGWSLGILVRELATLYRAFRQGSPAPLPELAIQYADFAVWQRGYLQGAVLERQMAWWKTQLAGAPEALALPTDRPRTAEQRYNGASVTLTLTPALTQQVRRLSQEQGATLYMTLLTAFHILMARYSGQHDVVVGSPIANRHRQEIEPLIGFFVNTLALRADLSANPPFLTLLAQVKATTQAAYDHQDLPFERLVEELSPSRTLNYNPLVQVLFALQNAPLATVPLPGLQVKVVEFEAKSTRFDLELHAWEVAETLQLYAIYNCDLFDQATMQRLLGHFQTLLAGIVANPQAPVSELPLLTAAERHQLLVEWNDTAADYPADKCIHQLVEEQVARTPDAVAVIFDAGDKLPTGTLTYRELNARANQLAHALRAMGVTTGELVGIALERTPEMIVAVLAILKAGGGYVPFDPTYPTDRLAYMLENAQVRLLITTAAMQPRLSWATGVPCFTDWAGLATQPGGNLINTATPEDVIYCLYTSGSTGKPKGVLLPQRAIVNLIHWQLGYTTLSPQARTLQFGPLSFDASCEDIFSAFCAGGALVLIDEETRRDPYALLQYIEKFAVERIDLPFVALQQLAEVADGWMPSHLREIITAGEQLIITPPLAKWFRHNPASLQNYYGPTEAHVVTALTLPTAVDEWPKYPSIGRPISNTQIYLLDQFLQPIPIGVLGELYIGGVALAHGYAQRPDLTAERFISHPQFGRLYKTGDLARWLPDGNIEFLGRIDHQVKIRGFRVELGEIETVLARHPAVQEAAVLAREDKPGVKQLVAYWIGESDQATLRQYLAQQLPEYMVPAAFVKLTALPLTPSGKLDRRALPAPTYGNPQAAFAPPTTPTEMTLAAIWSEVLGIAPIGIHDQFFSIGGHSLLATQVISRIRQTYGLTLPLRTLFEQTTIARLAEAVELAQLADVDEAALAELLEEVEMTAV